MRLSSGITYYQSHDQLKSHLQTFLMAYNYARRLKTLKGPTPYEHVCKTWTTEPHRFTIDPAQHTVGLNTPREALNKSD